ncbi:MAG: 2-C-methyl-D-erythritol 2,4-cyclodiphosphate synthase [Bacilli bacterium]|nr:2-C-methyl-D-erythritol 2,4-cyclodiphosphate synthase [Bacilli bacterium]
MRIGFASDIHQLVENRKLILGGVVIPFEKGEKAHSDGDVVYHALGESILGALALGDLGTHFPDNDNRYKDMDSSIIIKEIKIMMDERGYKIGNVDISITLEQPKLKPHIQEMRNNIARLLDTDVNNISVKAGTNEKMDEIGKGNAVKADSIVLLIEK